MNTLFEECKFGDRSHLKDLFSYRSINTQKSASLKMAVQEMSKIVTVTE